VISFVTVQAFGLGINPFGHKILAAGANSLIHSGVVIKTSKSNVQSLILVNRSADPQTSAQDFLASSNLSSETNTATFVVFHVPKGKIVVHLNIWSLYLGFAFVLIASSTVASNLTFDVFLTKSTASANE
jgi:hypothetical protein